MTARLHVAPPLSGGGPELEDDFTDEERHGTVTLCPFERNAGSRDSLFVRP